MNRTFFAAAFAILAAAAHGQSRPVSTDPGQMAAELTSQLFELDSRDVNTELAWCLAAKGAANDPSLNVLSSHEIPGRKIAWYKNRTMQAYCEAAALNKPLVLVLGINDPSRYPASEILLRSVLPCPHIARFAGAAVFAWGSPERDEYAKKILQKFDLKDLPATLVIQIMKKPDGNLKMKLAMQWEGVSDAATLGAGIAKALGRPAGFASNDPRDWPGLACTDPALTQILNRR